MVVDVWNHSTWEMETGRLGVQGQTQMYSLGPVGLYETSSQNTKLKEYKNTKLKGKQHIGQGLYHAYNASIEKNVNVDVRISLSYALF